jgi:hypothetical protein
MWHRVYFPWKPVYLWIFWLLLILQQTLIDASKEVGLQVNTEKTKYMLLSRHQNAGQNRDIKIGNGLKMWYSSDIWERQ